jgi:hypothetical protein
MIRDGELLRVYRDGRTKQPGFLTDYAFVANGLIDLYESSFKLRWLQLADQLAGKMIAAFSDSAGGALFLSAPNEGRLLVRQKDSYDGATPSGNSEAAMALLRLSTLLDKSEYAEKAQQIMLALAPEAEKMPSMYMNLLNAYHFQRFKPREVAIVGAEGNDGTKKLLSEVYHEFIPNKVVALLDPTSGDSNEAGKLIPLLRERPQIDGKATAYVCENYACKLPVTTSEQLAEQLRQ